MKCWKNAKKTKIMKKREIFFLCPTLLYQAHRQFFSLQTRRTLRGYRAYSAYNRGQGPVPSALTSFSGGH